jgi:hypothetical protein
MAAQTGRTVSKFVDFYVDNSSASLSQVKINNISLVGLVYEEHDMTAYQDAVKSALAGMPDAPIEISGPFDSTASTGSHVILNDLPALYTPLALDVRFGIRHAWESGEPTFGITGSATNGYHCVSYVVDPNTFMFTAKFVLFPGSAAPAWDTSAHT